MRNTGVREISRMTGFSPATVSNALNKKRSVNAETAEIIYKAAQELGYTRRKQLSRICFVLARKTGEVLDEGTFHPVVIEGVEKAASALGLQTTYVTVELSNKAAAKQAKELISDPTCAIVLLGTEMAEEDYTLFDNSQAPLVVVDGWCDHIFFDCVVTSNENSAFRAVKYLINCGHTQIGYIYGKYRIKNFPLRERGARRALSEAHLKLNPTYYVGVGTTVDSAYTSMHEWLAHAPSLPTAFFVENDTMALGVMRAMSEAGIKVPHDVSIIGFDDLPFATAAIPPLTTMKIPNREMGSIAVDLLMEQIKHPRYYTKVIHLSTKMITRGTVSKI